MSRVLAAQPAEVQPPIQLCPDWGRAREGNYRLMQESTKSARAATWAIFKTGNIK